MAIKALALRNIKAIPRRLIAGQGGFPAGPPPRLDIARTIATGPDINLMDALSAQYTGVLVTHSMQQAARVRQQTAFFHLGKLIECDATGKVVRNPAQTQIQDHITGRFD